MPVYNAGNYLREAIESILSQSFKEFEFIIINDGSADQSLSIIQSYKDERIKLLNNESNRGLVYSLNLGIERSAGEFILRMDADDISLPQRIETQLAFMRQNPETGVCGSNCILLENGKESLSPGLKNHAQILGWMLFNASVVHPSLIIRRSVLKQQALCFDKNFEHAEDYELWSRLILKTGFASVPEPLLKYRVHSTQVTQKHRVGQIASADKVRQNLLSSLGFKFNNEELRVHNLIGSSTLITSIHDLQLLESWFRSLLHQNQIHLIIEPATFNAIIGKQWYDACGLTNLGMTAYREYFKSELKRLYTGSRRRLLAKCLLRRFRKA